MSALLLKARLVAVVLLAGAGVWQLGGGVYIHAKAALAQVLLERAWSRTQSAEDEVRPWSWADTWPVARLTAPEHDIDQIVLAGASGASLAFGPGHMDGTATPGSPGNTVIGGHRDTHFAFLEDVAAGDELGIQAADGQVRRYIVVGTRVVDHQDARLFADPGQRRLTLVTCYPFDALIPGGPQRYLVEAVEAP